jgi:hypothetical protein
MKLSLTPTPLLQPLGYTFSTILVGLNEGVKSRESACLGVIINGMGTVPIQTGQPELLYCSDASWSSSRLGDKTMKSSCGPPAKAELQEEMQLRRRSSDSAARGALQEAEIGSAVFCR